MSNVDRPVLSASLSVQVWAIGRPGSVGIAVVNTGPQQLSDAEKIRTLRSAIETLEMQAGSGVDD